MLLSGEPGIGKSRLTAALMEQVADEQHTRLRYFCSPQHTDNALYPIISKYIVELAASGLASMYLVIEACPRKCWSRRVSIPWPPVRIRSNAATDMHRERQPGDFPGPLDLASNAHPAERLAALIDEDVGPFDPVGLLRPMQELETQQISETRAWHERSGVDPYS